MSQTRSSVDPRLSSADVYPTSAYRFSPRPERYSFSKCLLIFIPPGIRVGAVRRLRVGYEHDINDIRRASTTPGTITFP